jgi:predicted 3-demethylubiquinone-9 3-methyltransferase (glyoxalase superfamily)
MPRITPFLWFDTEAEEAANFYVSVFPNSKIAEVVRNNAASPAGTGQVMTVAFELDGLPVTALNGGPHFKFNEAASLVVHCKSQDEVDYYWDKLLDGGSPSQCGWLKDRYGFFWQIVPDVLLELIAGADREKAARVTAEMLTMVKLDIARLIAAANG